jgi:WD40 repeat protein
VSTAEKRKYNAFISYSHAVDGRLAPALQSAVRRFASPWYRPSQLKIFRDHTDLSVTPDLWSTIEQALATSEFLILLASPRAAASKWVARELNYWLTHRSPQTLMIVVTEGKLEWNDAHKAFDSDALPDTLGKAFSAEPLYLDLRSVSRTQDLAHDNPVFRDAVAMLAATLSKRPKDDLIGEDVAIRRRARRVAWAMGTVLLTLTVLLAQSTRLALSQRDALAESLQVTKAQKLLAEAQLVRAQGVDKLETSALLTLEAIKLSATTEATAFLSQTVSMLMPPIRSMRITETSNGTDKGIDAIAITADSHYIATAGGGPLPHMWNVATGKEVRPFHTSIPEVNEGYPLAAAFVPDGSQLVTSSLRGITFWNTANGEALKYVPSDNPIRSMATSRDGRYLASGKYNGEVIVVDRVTGRQVLRGKHESIVNAVAFSPDSNLLASGSNDNTARIWSLAKARELQKLQHGFGAISVEFSPDGKQLATGGWEGLARVWDVASSRQLKSFDHRNTIKSLAFSTDGKRLATAGDDTVARVWDLATGIEVARATHDVPIAAVAFSPDGNFLATASGDGITLWKTSYGNEIAQLAHPDDIVTGINFSPNGDRVVTVAGTSARVWDIQSGRELFRLQHDGEVGDAIFTADGNSLTTMIRPRTLGKQCIYSWDSASNTRRSEACEEYWSAAFSQDGTNAILTNVQGKVTVRDFATGKRTQVDGIADAGSLSEVAIGRSHRHIAVATYTGDKRELFIADAVANAVRHHLTLDEYATQLAFSTDERLLAMTTDHELRIFDVESGRDVLRRTLAGGISLAFTADGRYIAIGARDQSVRVLEIPTGREMARFELGGNAGQVAFSPNMELLAAASSDRTARIWKWRADSVKDACAHLSRNLTQEEWRNYFGDEPRRATCSDLK